MDICGVAEILQRQGYDGWVICENKRTLDAYRGLLKLGWFVNQSLTKSLEQEGA